nr:diguanylate cyclase [Raoultella sp. NCTC 9187]
MAAHALLLYAAHCRITMQNLIQKRSDTFTQGLMDKLLKERNTLND